MLNSPEQIFSEYNSQRQYKASIGSKGLYEQIKVNERFFAGDQWYGAKCGNERPLVRHNLIKRIGDYKMSVLLSNEANITYSAEGVPNTIKSAEKVSGIRRRIASGENVVPENAEEEIALVVSALNDYQRVTAERLRFSSISEQALKNAYVSGTGVIYTYWDPEISTGLYADANRGVAIKGDIKSEVIGIEDVYFGDPKNGDIQSQPYIIIASTWHIDEVRRYAMRFSDSREMYDNIKPDNAACDETRVTVLTKLFKEWNEDGSEYKIYAKMVTETATVRDKWDIGVRLYPLAVFRWERRTASAYGDSEITYLIPNQIAVNRMITSGVWSAMSTGMPTLVVNGDVVDGEITNDPGQIIKVFGTGEEVESAIRYVSPPDYSGNFVSVIEPLIENTLTQSGASSAALGDVDPNNTSAILTLRNAAIMPLKMLQNRYFEFLEEISRIWAEFWITQYGKRKIKISDENGVWYMPFDGDKYRDLIICSKAEVTSVESFDAEIKIKTLDNLLSRGAISVKQYLKRLPRGVVPEVEELIRTVKEAAV